MGSILRDPRSQAYLDENEIPSAPRKPRLFIVHGNGEAFGGIRAPGCDAQEVWLLLPSPIIYICIDYIGIYIYVHAHSSWLNPHVWLVE